MAREMSNISVYLSSTKHLVLSDKFPELFIRTDIPVCAVGFSMMLFGSTPHEREDFENQWSQTSLNMAKYVVIDSKKRTLYIGDNKQGENNTGLVEYEAPTDSGIYSNDFFKRWEETKILLFEYTVFDVKKSPLFCLKGLWGQDRWQKLDITPRNNIQIIPPI